MKSASARLLGLGLALVVSGWLLPAGPLREPVSRARRADVRVYSGVREGDVTPADGTAMRLAPLPWRALAVGVGVPELAALPDGSVHAIAGIAHPERFFELVARLGVQCIVHAFPDHHAFTAADLAFPDARAILMTEKDAVKCRRIADARMFCLPVRAAIDPALVDLIEDRLHGSQAARASRVPGHQGAADL